MRLGMAPDLCVAGAVDIRPCGNLSGFLGYWSASCSLVPVEYLTVFGSAMLVGCVFESASGCGLQHRGRTETGQQKSSIALSKSPRCDAEAAGRKPV